MTRRIKSVTIVGGGTASWMAASYLVSMLGRPDEGEGVEVTLIESPNFATIGVGEPTVPLMHLMQRYEHRTAVGQRQKTEPIVRKITKRRVPG